jgi:hypothetical protein
MRPGVGIEIGMIEIHCALAQKARIGELVEGIINGRERNQGPDVDCFLMQNFRRHMTMAASEEEGRKRYALPRGT